MAETYADRTGRPQFTYKRMSARRLFVVEGPIDYGDGVPVSYVGYWRGP